MPASKKETANRRAIPGFSFVRSKKGFSEYILNTNGLHVLFKKMPKTKTVTTNIVYMVGSRHESRGETGITHMLEHMMFKPTGENGKKDKELGWKTLEDAGALMNANTWLDRTSYFFNLPVSYYVKMLEVEARRMRYLLLEDQEFLPERANVLSEYEMYAGEPSAVLEAAVVGAAYVSHTYGHDTIGHKPDIESFTVDKLKRYHDAFYWPNNAYLIVVGDIDAAPALKEIKRVFGTISSSPQSIPTVSLIEPEQTGPRRVMVTRQSPIQMLSINYKSVPANHADWVPLYLLLTHLADGRSSILEKVLVRTHKASSVHPYQVVSHDAFLSGINITLTQQTKHIDVEVIVKNEIEKLKDHLLSKKDLARIKAKLEASELFMRDGGFKESAALTEYIGAGDWTRYFTIIDAIRKTTVEDIKRVARTYCIENRETVGVFKGTSS